MNNNIPEIFNLPVETSIASGDLIPIFDVSAGQIRKITQANLTAGVGVTDHGGLTGLDDDDHSAVYPGYAQTETITGQWTFALTGGGTVLYNFSNTMDGGSESVGIRLNASAGDLRLRAYAASHALFADSVHVGSDNASGGMFLGGNDPANGCMILDESGNVVIGLAQLADNATDGFLYIPGTTSGIPSGTPTTYSGRHPLVFDDTNNKLYIYDGSWLDMTGYVPSGTDVALADGGTGASLADPNADRIMFWDDSAGAVTWLTAGSGLTITDTTITATSSLSPSQTVITNTATVSFADPGSQYTMFYVECWGGGGSGGKGRAGSAAGGGGGGGYSAKLYRRDEITFPATVAIASGGASQTTADSNGNVGGTTTFTGASKNVVAYGGGPGMGTNTGGINSGGSGGYDGAAGQNSGAALGHSWFGAAVASAGIAPLAGGGTGGSAAAGQDGGNGFYTFGGGGGGASSSAAATNGAGGSAVWGGGGGGAGAEDSSPGPGAGGASAHGGAGGAGAFDANAATAGTQPGGGGGGGEEGNSGKGGDGQIRITYW